MSRDQELEEMLQKVRESFSPTSELQIRQWQSAVQNHRQSVRKESSRMKEWMVAAIVGMVIGASLYRVAENFNRETVYIAQFSATEEHVYVNSN